MQWSGAPTSGGNLKFSTGTTYQVKSINGNFFTTIQYPNLWAPISAVVPATSDGNPDDSSYDCDPLTELARCGRFVKLWKVCHAAGEDVTWSNVRVRTFCDERDDCKSLDKFAEFYQNKMAQRRAVDTQAASANSRLQTSLYGMAAAPIPSFVVSSKSRVVSKSILARRLESTTERRSSSSVLYVMASTRHTEFMGAYSLTNSSSLCFEHHTGNFVLWKDEQRACWCISKFAGDSQAFAVCFADTPISLTKTSSMQAIQEVEKLDDWYVVGNDQNDDMCCSGSITGSSTAYDRPDSCSKFGWVQDSMRVGTTPLCCLSMIDEKFPNDVRTLKESALMTQSPSVTKESKHPYLPRTDDKFEVKVKGAKSISVSFDPATKTEGGCDWIGFYSDAACSTSIGSQWSGGQGGGRRNFPGVSASK